MSGNVSVDKQETEWRLTPREPWRAGNYQLVVDTALEDLAGNHIGQAFDIDVFDRGQTPLRFTATASAPWIVVSQSGGTVDRDLRLSVRIDWDKAPTGNPTGSVTISAAGKSVAVGVVVVNPDKITTASLDGFVQTDRCVSMEAEHYTRKVDSDARVN